MRIWHEQLIPKLCQKHLCAMWREGLYAFSILTNPKAKSRYLHHPAAKEFKNYVGNLWTRLSIVRGEMLRRKYNPKTLPEPPTEEPDKLFTRPQEEWQTLEEQKQILKQKGCDCDI